MTGSLKRFRHKMKWSMFHKANQVNLRGAFIIFTAVTNSVGSWEKNNLLFFNIVPIKITALLSFRHYSFNTIKRNFRIKKLQHARLDFFHVEIGKNHWVPGLNCRNFQCSTMFWSQRATQPTLDVWSGVLSCNNRISLSSLPLRLSVTAFVSVV